MNSYCSNSRITCSISLSITPPSLSVFCSVSHSLSFSLSPFLSLPLSLSLSVSVSHSLHLSLSHFLTQPTFSFSISLSQNVFISLSPSVALSHLLSLFISLSEEKNSSQRVKLRWALIMVELINMLNKITFFFLSEAWRKQHQDNLHCWYQLSERKRLCISGIAKAPALHVDRCDVNTNYTAYRHDK